MRLNRKFNSDKEKEFYFKAVVRNMKVHDKKKQNKINEYELSIGSVVYDKRKNITDIDAQLAEKDLLGWIELIENPKLYRAIKKLSVEDQIFISYMFCEDKTQQKLSEVYDINQSHICERYNKILRLIKFNMFNR